MRTVPIISVYFHGSVRWQVSRLLLDKELLWDARGRLGIRGSLKFVQVCLRKCVELQRMHSIRCQICCSILELRKMSCCLAQRLVSQALVI